MSQPPRETGDTRWPRNTRNSQSVGGIAVFRRRLAGADGLMFGVIAGQVINDPATGTQWTPITTTDGDRSQPVQFIADEEIIAILPPPAPEGKHHE